MPGLRVLTGSAFDVAQVASATFRVKATGLVEHWHLYEHRSGARFLLRNPAPGPGAARWPTAGVVTPGEHPAGRPQPDELEELLPAPRPLVNAMEAQLMALWESAAPGVFDEQDRGIRDRWVEYFVTSVAIDFARTPGVAPEPDLLRYVEGVLTARDEAAERARTLKWLEAPRAPLCAWVLQDAGVLLQDGLCDALSLGPLELVAAVSNETLQALAGCICQRMEADVAGGLLRLSPADVVVRLLSNSRDQLLACLPELAPVH